MKERSDLGAASPDIDAVVTVYNPEDILLALCRELVAQARYVFIVDDGSSAPTADSLLHECEKLGCIVVRHPSNLGVAAALNTGVSTALGQVPRPAGIITLDQDSELPAGYIASLVEASETASAAGFSVGMVAPEFIGGLPSHTREKRGDVVLGNEPIQSGLLIPTVVFDEIGIFLEQLFIDAVDTEYYLRASSSGLHVVVAVGVALGHSLGNRYFPQFLGRRLRVRGRDFGLVRSAPFRYYYIARNHITMVRIYGRKFPGWAARETLLDLRHFLILLVLVPERKLHLRMITAGWRDGFAGVGGRIPADLVGPRVF